MFLLAVLFLASYLLGAVPFGWLVACARGVDILREGSGNIGATNVGRTLGKKFGILVFCLDFAKGAVPVAVAPLLAPWAGDLPPEALMVTAGIAAFLGHLFPVYLKFRGGKGVATGAGVVAVLVPVPALAAGLTWAAVVILTRYVSVASLVAAAMICVTHLTLTDHPWSGSTAIVSTFCVAAAGLVLLRHATNLRRLVNGTENRFKESPAMMLLSKTLHVLALGLWFGTVAFFTLAGVLIFGEFEKENAQEARPWWLAKPEKLDRLLANEQVPEKLKADLKREPASRAGGVAVRPLFAWFYGIQLVCAFITYGTALSWQRGREHDKAQRWRTWLLMLALIVTAVGWWLEGKVTDLRGPRDQKTDELLRADEPTKEQIAAAEQARGEFVKWHLYSLLQNFVTLLMVTVAMGLAARLPADRVEAPGVPQEGSATGEKKTPAAV